MNTKNNSAYEVGTLCSVNIELVDTNPDQPRKYFDPVAMAAMEESVKENGVLQPILVMYINGRFLIVAGERRYRAAVQAGLTEVPVIIIDGDVEEITLIENTVRADLTPIELAESLDRLKKKHGYTNVRLASIIGKAESTVSEILSLVRLPEAIRSEARSDPKYTRAELIEVAKEKSGLRQAAKFEDLKADKDGVKPEPAAKDPATLFVSAIESFIKRLEKLDASAFDQDKLAPIQEQLRALSALIGKKLATMTA